MKGKKKPEDNGFSLTFDDFDFVRDTEVGIISGDMFLQPQVRETLAAFQDNGIVKEVDGDLGLPVDDHFLSIRNFLVAHDIQDKTFNELSETSSADYSLGSLSLQRIQLFLPDTHEALPDLFPIILRNPPNSILYSYETSATLYASYETSSYPVFLHPALRRVMAYRYAQYKSGLEILKNSSQDMTGRATLNGEKSGELEKIRVHWHA